LTASLVTYLSTSKKGQPTSATNTSNKTIAPGKNTLQGIEKTEGNSQQESLRNDGGVVSQKTEIEIVDLSVERKTSLKQSNEHVEYELNNFTNNRRGAVSEIVVHAAEAVTKPLTERVDDAENNLPNNGAVAGNVFRSAENTINNITTNADLTTKHNIVPLSDTAFSPNRKKQTATRGIYFGIAAGPGLSKVKDGGFHKMGYEAGLLAGYRFTNRWSAETGIYFMQKHYWVKKEHFNAKQFNAAMPQGMQLMEVHGGSCIFQLPVHVRYDVLNRKKHRFFLSAGFSSSIMVKEHNGYTTMYNGAVDVLKINYAKNKTYFASAADISAGYEYQLHNKHTLRLQTYYQLPIKGMGVGLVDITTVGLRLGVTMGKIRDSKPLK
jgi:hypothetical protein